MEAKPTWTSSGRNLSNMCLSTMPARSVVISNSVLHLAGDAAPFESMLLGFRRVLKRGGLCFCRLGSTIGRESQVERIQERRYKSPDGSERYLAGRDQSPNDWAANWPTRNRIPSQPS